MIETLMTGSGSWNPLLWLSAFVFTAVLILWLRGQGEASYEPSSERDKPFLSGDEAAKPEDLHVSGTNAYWGLTTALRKYFGPLEKEHTGVLNDYFGWLTVILAICLIAISLG